MPGFCADMLHLSSLQLEQSTCLLMQGILRRMCVPLYAAGPAQAEHCAGGFNLLIGCHERCYTLQKLQMAATHT